MIRRVRENAVRRGVPPPPRVRPPDPSYQTSLSSRLEGGGLIVIRLTKTPSFALTSRASLALRVRLWDKGALRSAAVHAAHECNLALYADTVLMCALTARRCSRQLLFGIEGTIPRRGGGGFLKTRTICQQ